VDALFKGGPDMGEAGLPPFEVRDGRLGYHLGVSPAYQGEGILSRGVRMSLEGPLFPDLTQGRTQVDPRGVQERPPAPGRDEGHPVLKTIPLLQYVPFLFEYFCQPLSHVSKTHKSQIPHI